LKARTAQQSVHLTLGILRQSQAVFYALSFFQLDGFAVPAPAQVTQTVGQPKSKHKIASKSQILFLSLIIENLIVGCALVG
jgi:hypothetical protein